MYKNKKENSKAIATPELNNNEKRNISNPEITKSELYNEPTLTELVISNQGQKFIPNSNYNNQRTTHNSIVNNEIIQNIKQEMAHSIAQDPSRNLSSFNIHEDIIIK
jgi:hypothetical protein